MQLTHEKIILTEANWHQARWLQSLPIPSLAIPCREEIILVMIATKDSTMKFVMNLLGNSDLVAAPPLIMSTPLLESGEDWIGVAPFRAMRMCYRWLQIHHFCEKCHYTVFPRFGTVERIFQAFPVTRACQRHMDVLCYAIGIFQISLLVVLVFTVVTYWVIMVAWMPSNSQTMVENSSYQVERFKRDNWCQNVNPRNRSFNITLRSDNSKLQLHIKYEFYCEWVLRMCCKEVTQHSCLIITLKSKKIHYPMKALLERLDLSVSIFSTQFSFKQLKSNLHQMRFCWSTYQNACWPTDQQFATTLIF